MSDFVSSDDEGSYFDYEDFIYEDDLWSVREAEETSEDVSSEASESDLDIVDAFPITAHRQKYIVRYNEFEYY